MYNNKNGIVLQGKGLIVLQGKGLKTFLRKVLSSFQAKKKKKNVYLPLLLYWSNLI